MGTREIIRETLPWRRAAPEEFGAEIVFGRYFRHSFGFFGYLQGTAGDFVVAQLYAIVTMCIPIY